MSWITTEYVKYPARNLRLGNQKLSRDEIDRVVNRLSFVREETTLHKHPCDRMKCRKLDQEEIDSLVERLSKETRKKQDRVGNEIKQDKTITTSFAWCNGNLIQFHPKPKDGTWQ